MVLNPDEELFCIICSEQKTQGIRICEQWICTDCEREIVCTDVGDVRYHFFVEAMKKIWLSALSGQSNPV